MLNPKKSISEAKGYDIPLYLENYFLKLDVNENVLGPSPKVMEAIGNITEEDVKYYPAYGQLIEKLAEHNGVSHDMVLPTNGADEAINYVFNALIEPEDTVLTVNPSFAMPKIYAKSVGCKYNEVKYTKHWEFPIDEFLKNIDEAVKMVIVTTPNNPTGEAISRENLLKILEKSKNKIVMIDETYANYAEEKFIDLVVSHPNVLIIRSMSKDFALAGLRLGYIISQSPNIELIRRIISPYSVNSLAAKAGIAALGDTKHLELTKAQIRESKKILEKGLKPFAEKIYRTAANFVLADFGQKSEFVYKKLLSFGIKVKNFPNVPELRTCLRVTCPSSEQASKLVDCLKSRTLIAFDMDGVLVDTSNSYRLAIKGTYEHFSGKNLEFHEIQEAKNTGGLNNDWDLTEHLLKKAGFNIPKNDIIDKFQGLYLGGNGYIQNESFLLDKSCLKELSKNYDLAIFTGRPREEALYALKIRNLENFFPVIIAMEDVPDGFHKPDPWGLKKISDIICPEGVYYLGDTPDDMVSAIKAGAKGIGVLPPQDKSENLKEKLLSEGAVAVLKETKDLMEFLGVEK